MRRTFFYLIAILVFSCNERSGKTDRQSSLATKDYPTRPVRLIEPFGAGGGPDVIARAISPKLFELWGQPVISGIKTVGELIAAAKRLKGQVADPGPATLIRCNCRTLKT